jgi:hypothetical protein
LSRPTVEVADIFRHRGPVWRASHAGHVSLGQLKVMSAIERCRTAALGGHVERCEACAHLRISYNSCRNRHCPKCQAVAAKEWLADRQAELLPVPYFDGERVTFKWKDYRTKADARYKLMTLDADQFIRRFLIHVLPDGFHRIRHYGLLANGGRAENIARARQLLNVPAPQNAPSDADGTGDGEPQPLSQPCPCCGGRMIIIEIFERGCAPRYRPTVPNRVDSS